MHTKIKESNFYAQTARMHYLKGTQSTKPWWLIYVTPTATLTRKIFSVGRSGILSILQYYVS